MFLMVLAWLGAAPTQAESAEAEKEYFRAQTDRPVINLGDRVLYTVEVMLSGASQASPEITLPDLSGMFQVQDTVTRSSINVLNGRTYVINFKETYLIANHTGSITIPAAQVQWSDPSSGQRQNRATNPVVIQINEASGTAALPTPTPEIDVLRPNKSFAHISVNQWLPLAIGAVLVAGLFFGVSYLRRRPEPKPVAPPEPVDPRTPLQRALDSLKEAERLKQEGKVNELYTLLSSILRRYLEEEFNFKAQEMTTRELLAEMERLEFKQEFLEKYRPYFLESDHVKFANIKPEKAKIDTVDQRTRQIILEPDKRVVRPPVAPEAAETDTAPPAAEAAKASEKTSAPKARTAKDASPKGPA
jgi:hypothetical protein